MLAKIKDILIISDKVNIKNFEKLFGDGSSLGINIVYEVQEKPNGIAESFIIGESFIGNQNVCLVLGDNIFYGHGFANLLLNNKNLIESNIKDSALFACEVRNPQQFGVANFKENKLISIDEKPHNPKSNYAITGLYMYDSDVCDVAKTVIPSKRGELEITSINNFYIKNKEINLNLLERGFSWLDSGTHESLLESSNLIKVFNQPKGLRLHVLRKFH